MATEAGPGESDSVERLQGEKHELPVCERAYLRSGVQVEPVASEKVCMSEQHPPDCEQRLLLSASDQSSSVVLSHILSHKQPPSLCPGLTLSLPISAARSPLSLTECEDPPTCSGAPGWTLRRSRKQTSKGPPKAQEPQENHRRD
ncbi:hypothetical protein CRENBAI_004154 [Crenichthys baileyi]|uniref:Uncharacterized protein n=1 Tax=Crenichthys baileyi TaxID=28760 RepID=A0AAV9S853_9TELE